MAKKKSTTQKTSTTQGRTSASGSSVPRKKSTKKKAGTKKTSAKSATKTAGKTTRKSTRSRTTSSSTRKEAAATSNGARANGDTKAMSKKTSSASTASKDARTGAKATGTTRKSTTKKASAKKTSTRKTTSKKTTSRRTGNQPPAPTPATTPIGAHPATPEPLGNGQKLTEAQLKKVKTGLTKRDLEKFRQLLLEKRVELVGDVESLQSDARNDDASISYEHMADVGSDSYEQEFTLGLVESERKLLGEIDEALDRISKGTFGVCIESGEPISKARLEAKPWAKYTIEVAREREKRGL